VRGSRFAPRIEIICGAGTPIFCLSRFKKRFPPAIPCSHCCTSTRTEQLQSTEQPRFHFALKMACCTARQLSHARVLRVLSSIQSRFPATSRSICAIGQACLEPRTSASRRTPHPPAQAIETPRLRLRPAQSSQVYPYGGDLNAFYDVIETYVTVSKVARGAGAECEGHVL
jgi:hypothetical protein